MRNAVPAEATFGGEFRSRNTETLDLLRLQVTTALEQARKKYNEATIQDDFDVLFHMYNLDPNDPIVRLTTGLWATWVCGPISVLPAAAPMPTPCGCPASDCVVVGMSTNEMHTVNEYVVVPDLMKTALFCQLVMNAGK